LKNNAVEHQPLTPQWNGLKIKKDLFASSCLMTALKQLYFCNNPPCFGHTFETLLFDAASCSRERIKVSRQNKWLPQLHKTTTNVPGEAF